MAGKKNLVLRKSDHCHCHCKRVGHSENDHTVSGGDVVVLHELFEE